MANFRIVPVKLSLSATLTASPAMAGAHPVTRLQAWNRLPARTTGTADQQILGSWQTPDWINCVVLWRHNLTAAATWRLELFSGADQSGERLYDSGVVQANPPAALGDLDWGVDPLGATLFDDWALAYSVMWFERVAAISYRLTLSDPGNSAGYLEAAYLVVDRYREVATNMDYGLNLTWRDNAKQTRTAGGTVRTDGALAWREMTLSLSHLEEQERPHFAEIARTIGRRGGVFVSGYPESGGAKERDHCFLGLIKEGGGLTHNRYANHATTYTLTET